MRTTLFVRRCRKGVITAVGSVLSLLLFVVITQAGAQEPGERYSISPESLPAPFATPSTTNSPAVVSRPDDAELQVPPGFQAELFASGLTHARWLAVAPNGDVFLAEQQVNKITLLRDTNGDGVADQVRTFLKGLSQPFGMAFQDGYFYFADTRGVWRLAYHPGDEEAREEPQMITDEGALGAGTGHSTRSLIFSPDGSQFFVGIGSRGNIGIEPEPRATIKVFPREGGAGEIFAAGLRNPVGLAFYPGTDKLYTVVNERDGLGDGLVPDYLTGVVADGFYGWPYAYIGQNPQPGFEKHSEAQDKLNESLVPDLLFESHSAPLGLVFYEGEAFPEEFQGDAFVTLRGSWNAARPRGYMVVRVPFQDSRPQGHYEAFATGFRLSDQQTNRSIRAEVWGRPVGLAIAQDGSLLVADDTGQTVWRISYHGE